MKGTVVVGSKSLVQQTRRDLVSLRARVCDLANAGLTALDATVDGLSTGLTSLTGRAISAESALSTIGTTLTSLGVTDAGLQRQPCARRLADERRLLADLAPGPRDERRGRNQALQGSLASTITSLLSQITALGSGLTTTNATSAR